MLRSFTTPIHTLLCLSFLAHGSEASQASVAVMSVRDSESLPEHHPGYFATFSGHSMPEEDIAVYLPEDPRGCDPYSGESSIDAGFVAVVSRGNCTFVHKARMAQASGAKGVIIVSDSQVVQIMGGPNGTALPGIDIFVLGVDRHFGEQLGNASLVARDAGDGPLMMSVVAYESTILNVSEAILICLATALVALGAIFSSADLAVHPKESLTAALAAPQEEVAEVDEWAALGFCVLGSCALVVLFFFMQYMIYFVLFGFSMGGISCITQFGGIFLSHNFPALKSKSLSIPMFGPVSRAELLAAIPAISVVACFVVLRNTPYGWPFQDIIGCFFLCSLQRTIRLPNIQVATLLLSAMFFFDIFWVFISPLFFQGKSVMVSVATGGGTGESVPMLLRIPTIGDQLGGNDRLLGFGDIALPGLLISFLRRHDLMSARKCTEGYFLPALVGYFVGLNLTIAALCIMRMGQPALLYLVPCTLGTTLLLAKRRGELGLLWEGYAVKTEIALARNEDGV